MKVRELINALLDFDPDQEVAVRYTPYNGCDSGGHRSPEVKTRKVFKSQRNEYPFTISDPYIGDQKEIVVLE